MAEGPKEAMQIVRNTPAVELVLMDMNYTRATDGEEGLTLLRKVKVFRPRPCILMTVWGTILSTSTDAEELEPLIRKALNIE